MTLMAVALFHGSMSSSRAAANSAPAKFGIRPCGGNGKRATPSAQSLSQTHCRAALLAAKSQAMAESGAARPGDSQGRNLLHEKPRGDPRLADVEPSLIGALNSPHDKSPDKRQSLETTPISRGTESSNPAPSSSESVSPVDSGAAGEKSRAVAARCA